LRPKPAAVVDANVLAEAAASDLLLRLAEANLWTPHWTQKIWAETRRTWVDKLGWPAELAESRILAATAAFPEALVSGYEHLEDQCSNHPDDRHVLAAAIQGKAEAIVTFNTRDFKEEDLVVWKVSAHHPTDFLLGIHERDPAAVMDALETMAIKARRTVPEMLARLAWYVAPFVAHVAKAQSLQVPVIKPTEWKR